MTQREKFDAILQISEISLEKQYKLTNKKVPRRSQFTDPDAPKKKSKGARHYRDQNLKTLFKSSLIRKYRKPQESDDDLEPDVAQDSPENTPAPPTKSPESSGFSENLENLGANTPSPSPDFEEEHLEKKPETGNLTENRPKRVRDAPYLTEKCRKIWNYLQIGVKLGVLAVFCANTAKIHRILRQNTKNRDFLQKGVKFGVLVDFCALKIGFHDEMC